MQKTTLEDVVETDERVDMLFVGGCDLSQMSKFISFRGKYNIKKEFNTVIDGRDYRTSDSFQIRNALELPEWKKKELCKKIPFLNPNITFCTDFYNHKYKVIVYSVVDDYVRGLYKSKEEQIYVGFAFFFDQRYLEEQFSDEELLYLYENFEYVGKESVKQFEENICFLIEHISRDTILVLINGPEVDTSKLIGQERVDRNLEMNLVIDKIVASYDNVLLLDMREIVTDEKEVIIDNRHFCRSIYFDMASRLTEMLDKVGIKQMISERKVYEKDIQQLQSKYSGLQGKRICIYGTGKNAENIIFSLKDYNLIGVLDRDRIQGRFFGLPILKWEDIQSGEIDCLIIAADKKYISEIFNRIKSQCYERRIELVY